MKRNGAILIGTCTSVHEAITLEKSGVDIVCVQGFEVGGHRGSLLRKTFLRLAGYHYCHK
nr:nitronate monooxygenase [Pedobacter agri]